MIEENNFVKFGAWRKNIGGWILRNIYPIVIALASILVLLFVPMIGSSADLGTIIPTEPRAAFLFWTIKGLTIILNVMIFSAFRHQAKKNSETHPNFIKAQALLALTKDDKYKPKSPLQFSATQWGTKGITLILTTAVTSLALTNIILNYDWITAVSCFITIVIAIIFGLMTLSSEEFYWTQEYVRYAEMKSKEMESKTVNDGPSPTHN